MEKFAFFMEIDGKNYKLNKIPKQISLQEITQDSNNNLAKLFSIFDNGDKTLNVKELNQIFNIFLGWDKKDKDGKSDNKLTDEEIQQTISSNEKLIDFSVSEVKIFLKSILNINEKNTNNQKAAKRKQINERAAIIAKELYEQISGPSLNKNTIEKLKQITSENAAQVLYEYEELAGEPLFDALNGEWGFKLGDIVKYICIPLAKQAKAGIELNPKYYNMTNKTDEIKEYIQKWTDIIDYEKQPKEKPDEIAKLLYTQIKSASLNKNTLKLLKKVTSKNAAQVVFEYQKLAGQSLSDAIDEEWGLDYANVKKTIVSKLIKQGKSTPNMSWFDYEYSDDIYGKNATNTFINKLAGQILQTIDMNKYIPEKINPNDYTYEKLKAKYPKCTVRQNGNIIQIRNNSGTFKMQVIIDNDGDYSIEKLYETKKIVSIYKQNGDLESGVVEKEDVSERDFFIDSKDVVGKIVENLIEDFSEKKYIFFNTTKDRILADVSRIDKKNVVEVLNVFKKQTGKYLIETLKCAPDIEQKDLEKIINNINRCITQVFNDISKSITDYKTLGQQQELYENGIVAEFCTNLDIPVTVRKNLSNKIYRIMSEKIKSMNPKEMEQAYEKDDIEYENISISEIISKEKALPKPMRNNLLKQLEDKLSQNIENMKLWYVIDYMNETIGYDYSEIKHPTKTELIVYEKGLPAEAKVRLLKQLKDKIFQEYVVKLNYDINKVKDISDAIDMEIEYIANVSNYSSAELIDKLLIKLNTRCLWDSCEDDEKELKMPNGKIDEISYQGHTGDCWLLASINALAQSPKGLDLLNNSIKVNKDKSVTVTLRGVNKTYTFSLKELLDASELATGDLDVRALEKAVEKYRMEEQHDDIVGDDMDVAYEILVGNKKNIWSWEGVTSMSDEYIDIINNPNTIVTVSFASNDKNKTKAASGEELHKNHAYTAVKADDKYVYLINPWNSSSLIKVTHKKFKSTFEDFYDMEL